MSKKTKILFASPEVMPFAGTGGLGEVAGSLPAELNRLDSGDMDCRVIMPLYGAVGDDIRRELEFLGCGKIPLAWRNQYMGIFSLKKEGVTYYFVDNEYYFKRDSIYGFHDDCERFAYFSRAVIENSGITGFEPDIIHANDWQTAMIPVYLKTLCMDRNAKSVFTVHNVEYQGRYGNEVIGDCLGLGEEEGRLVQMGGGVNLMKGALDTADAITTVSPTYARELTYPVSAFGLDEIIRKNEDRMRGILNGIDTCAYDPGRDPMIEAPYTAEKMTGKKKCKRSLQRQLGLPEIDGPMLTLISRLVPPKGIDIVMEIMDGVLGETGAQFVMLGTGDEKYEDYFRQLQSRYPDQVRSLIEFNTETAHRIYAGGDILLMPSRSEACGLAQMIACRYGNVPIVRRTGGLADSIEEWDGEKGNGFTFFDYTGAELHGAIARCLDLYGHRNKWRALVRHILKEDFSWTRSARDYRQLYMDIKE